MAQKAKPSPARAPQRRILRIGIIQGGRIIEECLLRKHGDITIGQGPRNSFIISSAHLPRSYLVFKSTGDAYMLNFAEGMDGRVTVGGGVRTLAQAREMGAAKKAGDWWHLPMDSQARGKLVIGDVTLLFQFVQAPPVVPRARLPATIQGSIGSRMDPTFTMVLAGCVALAAAMWITFQVIPKPKNPKRSSRLRSMINSELKRQHPKTKKPPKDETKTDTKEGAEGDKAGDAAKVKVRKPAGGGKNKKPGKAKGPLKKGSAEYKRTLDELTNISFASGDDKMKSVAIAGKCRTAAECKKAIVGSDHLRSGGGFGDLDDRAKTSSGSGGHGVGGSGPRSGSGGRRGLAGKRGKGGLGVKGTGTGSGSTVMAMRPKRVVMIRGMLSSFVPPPRVGGSAGSKVRAKIRARVYGLRRCYNQALINNPRLAGSVKISFMIMPNGRVSSVNVVSGMGGAIVSCVKGKVRRWHLGNVPNQVFYGPFVVRFTPGS